MAYEGEENIISIKIIKFKLYKNMKNLMYVFVAVIGLMSVACNENESECDKIIVSNEPAHPDVFVSELPSFPAEVIYVLGREYETIKNGESQKSPMFKSKGKSVNASQLALNDYIESRLIELYPNQAYVGLADDIVRESNIVRSQYELYLQDLAIWEESMEIYAEEEDILYEFVSIEDEIGYMQMSTDEESLFRGLNTLAL